MKYFNLLLIFSGFFLVLACAHDPKTEKELIAEEFELNKPQNLNELQEKYKDKNFNNCIDFFKAVNEVIQVYSQKVDLAFRGNFEYIDEIEELEKFLSDFKDLEIEMENMCPEDYAEFKDKMNDKLSNNRDKLNEVYAIVEFENKWGVTLQTLENAIEQNLRAVEEHISRAKQEVIEQTVSASKNDKDDSADNNTEP